MYSRTITRHIRNTNSKHYGSSYFGILMDTLAKNADIIIPVAIPLITSTYVLVNYKISASYQYLVRTGLGIDDIHISKNGLVLPLQQYRFINLLPSIYDLKIHAMTIEKIPFSLPVTLTIGPKDDIESLKKYSKLIGAYCTREIASEIIGDVTRTLSSSMVMEEILNNRVNFKNRIFEGIQKDIDSFGLHIYSINIEELEDRQESKYLFHMMQKKASDVQNKAKIDIADLKATVINAENLTNQKIQLSNTEYEIVKINADQKRKIAEIESISSAAIKDQEMSKFIEEKRFEAQFVKYRSDILPRALIEAEEIKIKADADYYHQQQKAAGIQALYQAQANGINDLIRSFDGNQTTLMNYLMLEAQQFEKLADANAKASQGLQPKIMMINNSNIIE